MINVFAFVNEEGRYEVQDDFKDVLTIKYLPQKTMLHKEGTPAECNFFIIKGIARCFMFKEGKDITTYFAVDNTPIAAIDVIEDVNKRSFLNIELLVDSIVAEMNSKKVMNVIFNNHEYTKKYCTYLNNEYVKLAMNQISNRFTTAKDRYNKLCSDYPQIIKHVKLSHIASYLDISLETLSRIRADNKR